MVNEVRAAIVLFCTCVQNNTEKHMLYDFEKKADIFNILFSDCNNLLS